MNFKIQKEIKRYTFIDDIKMKGTTLLLYYNGGKIKKLPYRASIKKLQKTINEIKKEIGFEDIKKIRDKKIINEIEKPMMFVNV